MIALAQQSNILDEVIHGEALAVLRTLPDNSVDAIVCDPPGNLKFMGKKWDDYGSRDQFIFALRAIMAEALRALKPGGHAFVWSLPRTSHWTGIALEDAGFEIRDVVTHLFGSGFPKSLAVDKAIDRMRKDDIRHVCHFLRDAIDGSEHSVKSLAEHFQFNPRMIEHWAARDTDSQPSIPTWEQWLELKSLLGFSDEMDAEVWRLNGRKGKPGDAWYEREVIGKDTKARSTSGKSALPTLGAGVKYETWDITAPATPEASQWDGWGTSLKPASENWWLCRKPLSEPTIAANVMKWGTGAINIDATRVGNNEPDLQRIRQTSDGNSIFGMTQPNHGNLQGRWPANLLLSHSVWCVPNGVKKVKGTAPQGKPSLGREKPQGSSWQNGRYMATPRYNDSEGMEQVEDWLCDESCPIRLLDEQSGIRAPGYRKNPSTNKTTWFGATDGSHIEGERGYNDQGGASRYFMRFAPNDSTGLNNETLADLTRYFYVPKASRAERNRGCEGLPEVTTLIGASGHKANPSADNKLVVDVPRQNTHPTVKPLALCRYLVRLITPPGGIVLDCFAGSGSTLVAAIHEGMHFIGIEMNDSEQEPYISIARARIEQAFREVQS